MEQWTLHSQGTSAFCSHVAEDRTVLLFPPRAPVLPTGSLLVVPRLLGLTLRPSAPVCVATKTP